MKKWLKNTTLLLIGVVLLIIIVPLTLNWFILKERQFDVVGAGTDWLQFWPVYLSAIGTLAITIATFYTLKANQKQLDNMIESEGSAIGVLDV